MCRPSQSVCVTSQDCRRYYFVPASVAVWTLLPVIARLLIWMRSAGAFFRVLFRVDSPF